MILLTIKMSAWILTYSVLISYYTLLMLKIFHLSPVETPLQCFCFFNMTTEIFSTFIAFQYNKNVSCLSLILPALNLESVISPGSLGSFYWDWYLGAWVLFS